MSLAVLARDGRDARGCRFLVQITAGGRCCQLWRDLVDQRVPVGMLTLAILSSAMPSIIFDQRPQRVPMRDDQHRPATQLGTVTAWP